MTPVQPSSARLRPSPSRLRRVWPVLAALALLLAGMAMTVSAAFLESRWAATRESTRRVRLELSQVVERSKVPRPTGGARSVDVPLLQTQLTDLRTLFQIAERQGVRLGTVQFRSEPVRDAPYLVRTLEFRLEEDYPRTKALLAALLGSMPHLYLDELRVDQGGDATGKLQTTLRLSLVYQATVGQQLEAMAREKER